ncbi:hypothetical protein ACDN41_11945 [Priestia aryabhattai]|uniref:hypothetical protein n=1 Tax=Priestia aryabhattai TaxID=412384 RepID=UPI003531CC75
MEDLKLFREYKEYCGEEMSLRDKAKLQNYAEIYEHYPRVALHADILGFNLKEIDDLITKAYQNLQLIVNYRHLHQKVSSVEIYLKMIMVRLGNDKDKFYKYINETKFDLNNENFEKYRKVVGRQNVFTLWALTL